MKKKEDIDDISVIVDRVKAEVREGMAGKKMTITDISLKMTEAIDEIKEAFAKEIEEVVQEEQDTKATNCPECGSSLKKPKIRAGKKYIHAFRNYKAGKKRGLL